MFGFDRFISPSLLVIVYYLCILGALISTVESIKLFGVIFGILSTIVTILVIRVFFELIMISFNNHKNLQNIVKQLERLNNEKGDI